MNAGALIQLIAAIGGSAALATLISVVASRRKNSAEVAEIWNRLTKDTLEREEKSRVEIREEIKQLRAERDTMKSQLSDQESRIRACSYKYDRLAGLTTRIINDLPEKSREEYHAALQFINDSMN